jgi:hypothetical protein
VTIQTKPGQLRNSTLKNRKPWRSKRAAPAVVAKQIEYVPRPREIARAVAELPGAEPIPKFAYVRSVLLRTMCRAMACQHCGASGPDAGVTWAHSNWECHGKGKSIKASDQYVAALCAVCHAAIDQGKHLTDLQRWRIWFAAHRNTVSNALARGIWPPGVLLPDFNLVPPCAITKEPQWQTSGA